jgi:hypothetical protein
MPRLGHKLLVVSISLLMIVTLLMSGCLCLALLGDDEDAANPLPARLPAASSPTAAASRVPAGPPPGKTGQLTTGQAVSLGSAVVKTAGGVVKVDQPGDPLGGFVLDVPEGAYARDVTFRLSYSPISSQTYGPAFKPLTPLITIDNGGVYSRKYVKLKIPAVIPAGKVAGAFIRNRDGTLDALPTVRQDGSSITVATLHFCDLVLLMEDRSEQGKPFTTGFTVGKDSWPFPNQGTYYQQTGLCNGMSLGAVWYYLYRKNQDGRDLFPRFDNNGRDHSTTWRWYDDALGYRYASMAQLYALRETGGAEELNRSDLRLRDEIALALRQSGRPQALGLTSDAGYAHAIVAYGVSPEGNILVYDPNRPEDKTAQLKYDAAQDRMLVYNAGLSTDSPPLPFNRAYLTGNQDANWPKLESEFEKVISGTIGDDGFPAYQLVYKDEQGRIQPLKDGMVTGQSRLWVGVESKEASASIELWNGDDALEMSPDGFINLKPGKTEIGFQVMGRTDNKYSDGTFIKMPIDFRYLNIIVSPVRIEPPAATVVQGGRQSFRAVMEKPPAGTTYQWTVAGSRLNSTGDTISPTFTDTGSFTVTVSVRDSANREVGTARATVTVNPKPATLPPAPAPTSPKPTPTPTPTPASSQLAELQKCGHLNTSVAYTGTFKRLDEITHSSKLDGPLTYPRLQGNSLVWKGTSFSASETRPYDGTTSSVAKVEGAVTSSGKTLSYITYEETTTWGKTVPELKKIVRFELTGMEILPYKQATGYDPIFESRVKGPAAASHLSYLEVKTILYKDGKPQWEEVLTKYEFADNQYVACWFRY